jgi:hypothetical protein
MVISFDKADDRDCHNGEIVNEDAEVYQQDLELICEENRCRPMLFTHDGNFMSAYNFRKIPARQFKARA